MARVPRRDRDNRRRAHRPVVRRGLFALASHGARATFGRPCGCAGDARRLRAGPLIFSLLPLVPQRYQVSGAELLIIAAILLVLSLPAWSMMLRRRTRLFQRRDV